MLDSSIKLDEEIKASIERSLPAQVGAVLNKRLQKIDQLEGENISLKDEIKKLKDEISKYEELSQYETELIQRENSLKNVEDSVKSDRFHLDLTIANLNLNHAEKRGDEMYSLLKLMFKAPVIQKSIQETFNRNDPIVQSYNGGTPYPTGSIVNSNGYSSKTETETTE